MNENEKLALTTAEKIAADPNARDQDRVAAARLSAQLRGQLTERNKPSGGGSVVQVTLPETCPRCGYPNPVLAQAEDSLGGPIRITEEPDGPELEPSL